MTRASFDAEARAEAREAARWYLERGGPPLARAFRDDLSNTAVRVARAPLLYAALEEPGITPPVRRALFQRFPYALVFVVLTDEIRVLAVTHLAREPLYWLRRVPRP